jgi:UDP-N-acetylmuramate--alanine ligase
MVVVCNDDPILRRLFPQIRRRMVTYGTRRGSDFHVSLGKSVPITGDAGPLTEFKVNYKNQPLGEFRLHVPGVHNVLNATAAIAVGVGLDIPADQIRSGLENFRGVDRRFQLRGNAAGVSVIDDYGHHPTEIRATLAAARSRFPSQRLWAVWQPHTFSRTAAFLDDFANAFHDADRVIVTEIFASREKPGSFSASQVINHMHHPGATFLPSLPEVTSYLISSLNPGDVLLVLSAGDADQVSAWTLAELLAKEKHDA